MNHKVALVVASLFVLFSAPAAFANVQHERMKACNVEAGDRKGDERKAYMKNCLSAKKAEANAAKNAQQQKMKTCNVEAKAKNIPGSERKKFMSECLRG
jgi:mannose/fructose/N-acetylgalactosamine-specific phosphotransferase system component IIB